MNRNCFFAAVAVLFVVLGAWAQTPTGAIEGTITDPSGAVIPGAKITITEVATGREIPLTTNELGLYSLRNLLPGIYRIRVEASGFTIKVVENVSVSSGAVVNGNVSLELGKTGEVISVAAEAVMVDTSRQTVDSIVGEKEIKDLPLFSRNFLDLAGMAPGVYIRDGGSIDPTKVVAYRTVGIGGRSGTATRVQVDGIDVTDETVGTTVANFSQESVHEFQLTRSSLDPSTSLTSSGAINIISKSGGNTMHGSWFWDYYNQDMGARLRYDQKESETFKRNRTGGAFGGPFVKDKLFWFASWERHYQTERSSVTRPLFPQLNISQDFPVGIRYIDGRADWNVNPSVRLFSKFHHNWDLATGGSAVSPFQNIDWTPVVTVGLDINRARMTHTYRFGFVKFHNRIESQELTYKFLRTPNNIPYYLNVGSFGAGPNNLAPQATYQTNYNNSYEGTLMTGKHLLRYGFDMRRIILGGFANFAGPLQVTGTYDADTVAQLKAQGRNLQDPLEYPLEYFSMGPANGFFNLAPAHGLPHGGHFITRPAFFVQDSIKLSRRLTLNLGVRWQYDTGYFAAKDVPREPQMERWGKGFSTRSEVPKTLFSPSFGFAWDPKGDAKTVIRGGFYKGYEMNILNNTMFDEFAMLPNGLGPDLYEIYGVNTPDGKPINIDGKHANGNYEDLIGVPLKNVIGLLGNLQAALNSAYADYKFDPARGKSAFLSSGGLYYGSVYPGNQYKMPYALQFNIGAQRELKPGTVLAVDYVYNHAVGLPFLRIDYEFRRDAQTLNVANARTKINSVLGGRTVDEWIAANPTRNITAFGLITDSIFMGLYPDMTRARFVQGGFTKYRAVQASLRGSQRSLWKIKDAGYVVSYSLGRNQTSSCVGRVEFYATPNDNRFYNGKRTFGPNGLDFTHMLSVASVMTVPGGFRLNSYWTFRTAAPGNVGIPTFGGPLSGTNAVFGADITGDNNTDWLPGVGAGQWGRKVKTLKQLNQIIQQWNQSQAGQLTPHGKALVTAGLFTEAQLKRLGAVSPTIPLALEGNPNPFNNLLVTDLRFDRPVKLGRFREGMEFTPFVDFYNLFNHSPAGTYAGLGTTFGSWNFDYTAAPAGQKLSDLTAARGRINATRKVMIGLRFTF